MSLFKRKDSSYWWIKLSVNGRRIQQSTGTEDKQKAREYHDKVKARLWDESRLGKRPTYTWKQAVVQWLEEKQHKATVNQDVQHFRWLDPYFGGLDLTAITRETVESITAARLAQGVSNATVNRMLEIVRGVLRRATYEWEWLDRCPKIRKLPEPKRRIRWLNREEAERLLAELPAHLAAMARFSLETGLRQGNVKGLQWSQVDLARRAAWVHPDQAKNRKALAVPLTARAVLVLREQAGKHPDCVFTYEGKPIVQVNTKAWKNALRRAGIKDFRWHDLRHTWASWHVQADTPLHVLQELGGWETADMVRRYAHLSSDHLAAYQDRMSGGLRLADERKQLATI